jgi:curli biogenesis system outer membrane secretion channel CsgG
LAAISLVLVTASHAQTSTSAPPPTSPTIFVLGLESEVEKEPWQDLRLGHGIRGRLTQMFAESGAFIVVEEKALAADLEQAVGGYWLRERKGAERADLAVLQQLTGVEWVAHGRLVQVRVTRDRVIGVFSGRRWKYQVKVELCLRNRVGAGLCQEGQGVSSTHTWGAVVEYQGEEVAFDQEGPANAVELALVHAFNQLMPAWEALP